MANSDLYEQRVVYTSLMRMSEDRNLIKAGFERWQTVSAGKPFDVFEIVADLAKFLGLGNAERKVLMVSMHAASNRLPDELAPVPEYISSTAAPAPRPAAAIQEKPAIVQPVSAHKAVTERYLQLISQHVRKQSQESFRELVAILSNEGLPKLASGLNKVVMSWGASGLDKINFVSNISSSECQDTALEFYVLLTEIIGPVESDVIVNKTISEVLSMEAANQFNPRNLL